jgi:hypothetical protein
MNSGRNLLLLRALGLAVIAIGVGQQLRTFPPYGPTWLEATFRLWALGLALLALSVVAPGRNGARVLDWRDIFCMAIVVIVVGMTRLIGFPAWPPPAYEMLEEVQLGAVARSIATHFDTLPQFLSTDLVGALALLIGPHTFTGLRTPFLAATIMAAVFWYAALRHYTSWVAALCGVCIIFTAPTAALMARMADEYLFPMTLVPVFAWGIAHAQRCHRLSGSVVAGMSAGLLFYEHDAYKPFVAAGCVAVALALWSAPRRAAWHVAFGVLAFSIIALPGIVPIRDYQSGVWLWEGVARHTSSLRAAPHVGNVVENARLILTELFWRDNGHWGAAVVAPYFGGVGACAVAVGCAFGIVFPRSVCGVALAVGTALFLGCTIIPANVVQHRLIVFFAPAVLATVGLLEVLCGRKSGRLLVALIAVIAVGLNVVALHRALAESFRYEAAEFPENLVLAAILEAPRNRYVILWWEEYPNFNPLGIPHDGEWLGLRDHRGEVFTTATQTTQHGPTRWIIVDAPEHAQQLAATGCVVVRRPSRTRHTTVDLVDCPG